MRYRPSRDGLRGMFVSPAVRGLVRARAEQIASYARSIAPVGSPIEGDQHPGLYRDSITASDDGTVTIGGIERAAAVVSPHVPYAGEVEDRWGYHTMGRAAYEGDSPDSHGRKTTPPKFATPRTRGPKGARRAGTPRGTKTVQHHRGAHAPGHSLAKDYIDRVIPGHRPTPLRIIGQGLFPGGGIGMAGGFGSLGHGGKKGSSGGGGGGGGGGSNFKNMSAAQRKANAQKAAKTRAANQAAMTPAQKAALKLKRHLAAVRAAARLTPAQKAARTARLRAAAKNRTPAQKAAASARLRAYNAHLSPAQKAARSARLRAANARRTPAQKAAAAARLRAYNAHLTPAQKAARAARLRAYNQNLTPAQKAARTARLRAAATHSHHNGFANLTPAQRSANARKAAATRAARRRKA